MKKSIAFLFLFIFCISCFKNRKSIYFGEDIEVVQLVSTGNKTCLIFDVKNESSMSWPDHAYFYYNNDSSTVKLFIHKYDKLLDRDSNAISSNILLVKDHPELKFHFKNVRDSIKQSTSYLLLLPQSVKKIIFPY